eukprot:TRINITY_DN1157_c0_g1_i4.p1 TRINITY_DN1157_c0_g1~~TRINITY_DN1157_c0_g1_i4.p1  ORF type:complete len:1199 (-),score=146.50 TRINITY_DN1157_c0_g1_i4:59-3655(-)
MCRQLLFVGIFCFIQNAFSTSAQQFQEGCPSESANSEDHVAGSILLQSSKAFMMSETLVTEHQVDEQIVGLSDKSFEEEVLREAQREEGEQTEEGRKQDEKEAMEKERATDLDGAGHSFAAMADSAARRFTPAAVGCMSREHFPWKGRFSTVAANSDGIQSCFDKCRSKGSVYGGLTCPTATTVGCMCYHGAPTGGDFWASPHSIKYSAAALMSCEDITNKCPGPSVIEGGYHAGGEMKVAVYGLFSSDDVIASEAYEPVVSFRVQPDATSAPSPSADCADPVGTDFATLVGVGAEDEVVVQSGKTLVVKSSVYVNGIIRVVAGGTLAFADLPNVGLSAAGIIVEGTLQMGTEKCPLRAGGASITLRGAKPHDTDSVAWSTKGIVAETGSSLDIHGKPFVPTWTRLATAGLPGSKTLSLQQPVNWEVGQRIVVVTTTFVDERGDHQNEVRTLTAVDGQTITFDEPLAYLHYGGPEYFGEVALLSRSITIEGDAQSEEQAFGGHTACKRGATCRISFARAYRMGQKNVMARYPFHFHMQGDVFRENYFRGLAVEHSFFRAYTIHGTSNSTLSSSVAYDVIGSAVYLEDGVEEQNLIEYNLIAHVHVIKHFENHMYAYDKFNKWVKPEDDRIVPTDVTAAAFYCLNPNNRWIGNVASGGFAGFVFPAVPQAMGKSANTFSDSLIPMRHDLLEFDSNTVHSSGQWFRNGACIYVGGHLKRQKKDKNKFEYYFNKFGATSETRGMMKFTNTKFFACRTGFKSWGFRFVNYPQILIKNAEFHDNMLTVAFFGHNALERVRATAHTANTGAFPSYTPAIGFQMYDTWFQSLFQDTVWRGYKGPGDVAMYQAVLSDCCPPSPMLGLAATYVLDTPSDKILQLNPGWPTESLDSKGTHGWQWANVQLADDSMVGLDGGAILGSGDSPPCREGTCGSHDWWKLDDDCTMTATERQSRGYYVCSKLSSRSWALGQERTAVTLMLAKSDQIGCKKGGTGRLCTNFVNTDNSALVTGTVYHFGREDRRAMLGWKNSRLGGRQVVGSCCDIGWFLHVDGGAPDKLTVYLDQLVPEGGLVFATRYPAEASITVSRCTGGSLETRCSPSGTAETKASFLHDRFGEKVFVEALPDGDVFLFLKLVNEEETYFQQKNAKVLKATFASERRFTILCNGDRCGASGGIPHGSALLLPPENWAATDLSAVSSALPGTA